MTLKCVLCYLAGMVMLATMNGCSKANDIEKALVDEATIHCKFDEKLKPKTKEEIQRNLNAAYCVIGYTMKLCRDRKLDTPMCKGFEKWRKTKQ